jgi:hypothetical protein
VTDEIQAEKPSPRNRPIKSTGDQENPFKLPERTTGREWAVAALVVATAAFLVCFVQATFFRIDPHHSLIFGAVVGESAVEAEARQRSARNVWMYENIAFPACCTIPFAVLLALVSFYNGQSHRRLSKYALIVSIILGLLAALSQVGQILA